MRVIRTALPAILVSIAALSQPPASRPEFEVMSVKPSAEAGAQQVNVGVHIDGAQLHINYFSLKDYIRVAYKVKDYQVLCPDWVAAERFDIDAKLPAGASRDQVPEMLQSLLAERFQVKTHKDSKEFPVFGLVVAAGGLKMKESQPDPDAASAADPAKAPVQVTATGGRGGISINYGRGNFSFGDNRVEVKRLPMAVFADILARFTDRPVVDMTGLTGVYDFTLQLTPEDYRAMLIRSAIAAGVTIPPEALRLLEGVTDDSLLTSMGAVGLKLEPRKAPLEVLVVDSALKTPTAN